MTVTSDEIQSEVNDVVVQDAAGPLRFQGTVVADLSWDYDAAYESGHNRWTDITLYRVLEDDSPYKYVVQVVGRSVMYHRVNGKCRSGVNMPVGLLRQDDSRYQALISCDKRGCAPADLDELDDADMVAVEEDLYTLYRCKDAVEVITIMQNRGNRGQMSNLSVKLLQAASRLDPAFREAMMRTRRL